MKIVLLCGNQSNQHALALKISRKFQLAGIVFESREQKTKLTFPLIFTKLIDRLFFYKIISSWKAMLSYYSNSSDSTSSTPNLITKNVNSKEAIDFIKLHNPDLIVVSGTSLLKEELLNLKPTKGIINLHTGLSPYVKGGPNCTNWCIANNTMHLIGNTIMWIDKGIDSGNIITSEIVYLNGQESLNEIHIKVMDYAHDLYLRAIDCIDKTYVNCPSVKQSEITKGQLFLTKMWNFNAKLRFAFNIFSGKYKKTIKAHSYKMQADKTIVVKLPS